MKVLQDRKSRSWDKIIEIYQHLEILKTELIEEQNDYKEICFSIVKHVSPVMGNHSGWPITPDEDDEEETPSDNFETTSEDNTDEYTEDDTEENTDDEL